MRTGDGYVEGRDLMLYVDTAADSETPAWSPTAAATSHTISNSAETKERVTKDSANGAYGEKKVTKLAVSISCEALVKYNETVGWDKLLEVFKSRKPVKLKYGFANEETGDGYEEGLFVITSLEQSSPAGEDATYSASFENTGEVKTKKATVTT